MEFKTADIKDIPKLKELWKEIFNDDDGYIDLFFKYKMKPEYTFVAKENGNIVAAVYSVYSPLVLKDGKAIPSLYMCGICTKPECRGRQIASTLIKKCFDFAKEKEIDVCYLIPANQELFEFYEKLGFEKATFINKIECDCKAYEIPCFNTGYDKGLISCYDEFEMPFKPLRNEMEFRYIAECYSEILRFENGYMIFDEDDEFIYLMEQTFDGTDYAKNYAYEKNKKLIVFEPSDNTGTPFAVVKKINSTADIPKWGYINLMLN